MNDPLEVAPRRRYTNVPNKTINDTSLSFSARGVLAWLLSKPDGWRVDASAIANGAPEGRKTILSALKELETGGYLERERFQDETGHWRSKSFIHERPVCEEEPKSPHGTSVHGTSVDGTSSNELLRQTTERETIGVALATQKIDLLWEALLSSCGIDPRGQLVPSARGAYNRAAKDLRSVGATPSLVAQRAAVFRVRWPGCSLTPTALARRWNECEPDERHLPGPKLTQVDATIARILHESP